MKPASIIRILFAAAVFTVVAEAARPAFVEQPLEPAGLASVAVVVAGESADLVLLDGGLAAGFRSGMVAHVERGNSRIARLLIVETTADRAVALILDLAPGQSIQSDDRVLRSLISIS